MAGPVLQIKPQENTGGDSITTAKNLQDLFAIDKPRLGDIYLVENDGQDNDVYYQFVGLGNGTDGPNNKWKDLGQNPDLDFVPTRGNIEIEGLKKFKEGFYTQQSHEYGKRLSHIVHGIEIRTDIPLTTSGDIDRRYLIEVMFYSKKQPYPVKYIIQALYTGNAFNPLGSAYVNMPVEGRVKVFYLNGSIAFWIPKPTYKGTLPEVGDNYYEVWAKLYNSTGGVITEIIDSSNPTASKSTYITPKTGYEGAVWDIEREDDQLKFKDLDGNEVKSVDISPTHTVEDLQELFNVENPRMWDVYLVENDGQDNDVYYQFVGPGNGTDGANNEWKDIGQNPEFPTNENSTPPQTENEKSDSVVPVDYEFEFLAGDDQKFLIPYGGHVQGIFVGGQKLIKSQYNEWHNAIEIMPTEVLQDNDVINVTTFVRTNWKRIHGFRFKVDTPAPEVERIGADMSEELPIQKGMKGCTVLDNGRINYFLGEEDWAKKDDDSASDLTGADGQVMVRLPRHWVKDYVDGDYRVLLFSDEPFEATREVPQMYIGAYKAALNRNGNILSSVVNATTDYRGGNNQSAWDNEGDRKTQIGKPVSNINRIDAWDYAKNRGANWYPILYQAHEAIAWLATYEYGTRDHQAAISDGPTGLASSKWNNFNSRYPLFQCGLTDGIGNGTGEIPIDLTGLDLGSDEINVFRYRGLENWWGDIYEWMSGVNVLDNKFYLTNGKLKSDTGVEGYQLIGSRPTSNGYVQEMWPGTVLPKTNSGSSSTYYADYLYANDTESIRGLLRSASASHAAAAGSFLLTSHCTPSRANAYRGSRLCFVRR